jgi:hypothetical protein
MSKPKCYFEVRLQTRGEGDGGDDNDPNTLNRAAKEGESG